MTGIITVQGVALPNTLPRAVYDRLIMNGTLGVWDAKNPKSWPSQAAPTADALTLRNLAQPGVLDANVGINWTWSNGLVRPAAADARINLGAPDLSTEAHGYAFTVWVKLPSVPTVYTPLLSRLNATGSGVDNQFSIGIGVDGKLRGDMIFLDADGVTLRYISLVPASGPVTAGVHQFGLSVTFSGNSPTYKLFQNGAEIASSAYAGTRLNPSTLPIGLGNRHGASAAGSMAGVTYFRALIEDLTASGRTGAQVVAADWAANSGRFS